MSVGNAQVQRSTAVLNIGTINANVTKDVTFAVANAKFSTNPLLCDSPLLTPAASNSSGVSNGEAFVSAAGVITARFANSTSASIAAGTAVTYKIDLIKATGAI